MTARPFVNAVLAALLATPAWGACTTEPVAHGCGGHAVVELCTDGSGTLAFFRPSGAIWALEFRSDADFTRALRQMRAASRTCRRGGR